MKKDNSYVEYIVYDVLGHIDGLTAKKMFSGAGVYLDGSIVALVIDGELYFKSNAELMKKYSALGCHPFTYDRNGKMVTMSYMSATEEMLEDRETMSTRIYESYDVSNIAK